MFGVEWLKGPSSVAKETSVLNDLQAVIESCKSKAPDMKRQHPGNEPDSVRILDAFGKEAARFGV